MFPPGRPAEARLDQPTRLYLVPALLIGPGLVLALLYVRVALYAALFPSPGAG
ncbi:MAG: hypothetical protein U1F54_17365 [Burkholderiales bacterium]